MSLAVEKKWQRLGEGRAGIVKGKATGIVKGSLGLAVGLAVEKKWQRIGEARVRYGERESHSCVEGQRIGEARSGKVKGKGIRVWRSSIGGKLLV